MNYASIRTCDIANGDGVRVSLFVSGCTHRCPGCFNAEAQAFDYGETFTRAVEDRVLDALRPGFIAGLTLLGGEPMEPENQRALVPFLRRFRERFGATKTLWVYTGCVIEQLGSWKVGKLGSWEVEKLGSWKVGKLGSWEVEKLEGDQTTSQLSNSPTPQLSNSPTLQLSNSPTLSRWRTEVTDEFLAMTDVLVDGPFVEALKDISLRFRGSSNQRILDLAAMRRGETETI